MLHSLLALLLPLEVRLGEGLHGRQQAHLRHFPAEGHWLGLLDHLLSWTHIHLCCDFVPSSLSLNSENGAISLLHWEMGVSVVTRWLTLRSG